MTTDSTQLSVRERVKRALVMNALTDWRGGIVDVWPPAEELPLRIELFGDEVESIRTFDPATQRSYGLQKIISFSPI